MLTAARPPVIKGQQNYPKLGLKHILCLINIMFLALLSQYELFFLSQKEKKPTTFSNPTPLSLENCPISPNSVAIVTAPMGGRGDIDAMRHMIETALELNKAATGIINLGGIFSSPEFFQQANPIFGQIDPNPKMKGCLPSKSNIKSYRVAIKGKKIPLFIAPDALSLVDIADLIDPLEKIVGPTPIFLHECKIEKNEACEKLIKALYGQNNNSGKTLIVTEAGLPGGVDVALKELQSINITNSNLQHLPLGLPDTGFLGKKSNKPTPIPCTVASYDYSSNPSFILLAIGALAEKCTEIGVFTKEDTSANKYNYIHDIAKPTFRVSLYPPCDKTTCIEVLKKFTPTNKQSYGKVKKTISIIPYNSLPTEQFNKMALLSYIFFASGDGSSKICQSTHICMPVMANRRQWALQIYKDAQIKYPALAKAIATLYLSNAAEAIEKNGKFFLKVQDNQQIIYDKNTEKPTTTYDENKKTKLVRLTLEEIEKISAAMKVGNRATTIIKQFLNTGKTPLTIIEDHFKNREGEYNISTIQAG